MKSKFTKLAKSKMIALLAFIFVSFAGVQEATSQVNFPIPYCTQTCNTVYYTAYYYYSVGGYFSRVGINEVNAGVLGASVGSYTSGYKPANYYWSSGTDASGLYYDYTAEASMQPLLKAGGTYRVNADLAHQYYYANYYNQYVAAWIDYNQDGSFDNSTERLFLNLQSYSNFTTYGTLNGNYGYYYTTGPNASYNFAIPCTAKMGPTRMRLGISYYGYQPTPCGTYAYSYCTQYGYDYQYFYYCEYEDYTVNISANLTDYFPLSSETAKPTDNPNLYTLYAAEPYNGVTPRDVNGVSTPFPKPFLTFGSPQTTGAVLNYKIIGPMPSSNTVWQATDALGNSNINIAGMSSWTANYATGSAALSNGGFQTSNGGEYRSIISITGPAGVCPVNMTNVFTVSWPNDLAVRQITSPKNNQPPANYKYLRGLNFKLTGIYQNVGLNEISLFDATARVYKYSDNSLVRSTTVTYQANPPSVPTLKRTQTTEIDFGNMSFNDVGKFYVIMSGKLRNASDAATYNDTIPRPGDAQYIFEVQNEFECVANRVLMPECGSSIWANKPVEPIGEFLNNGIGEPNNIPVKLEIFKASNTTTPIWTDNQVMDGISPGQYNSKTQKFNFLNIKEAGQYKAKLTITASGDENRSNDVVWCDFTVVSGLSGAYTVGNGGNFATIPDAMDALYNRGITGPVEFQLTDDVYNVYAVNDATPAWDFRSTIVGAGWDPDNNRYNTITWKPSQYKALAKGSVTINLYANSGMGVAFGQSITNSNPNAIVNTFSMYPSYLKKFANSAGYVNFDGGSQKSLKFVLKATNPTIIFGSAFYLGRGTTNISVKNVLVENGVPSIANSVYVPRKNYSATDGFSFEKDIVGTGGNGKSFSAGFAIRSSLSKIEESAFVRLDTVPNVNITITNNEINGFGYGIMSTGMGALFVDYAAVFARYYNKNNNYSNNTISNAYRAGIFLGFEENTKVNNNKIFNIGSSTKDSTSGILLGGEASKDLKGYNNIGLEVNGNEISGVTGTKAVRGIRVDQVQNNYPHPNGSTVGFPNTDEKLMLVNNVIWGLTSQNAATTRVGIQLATARSVENSLTETQKALTAKDLNYRTRKDLIAHNTIIIEDDSYANATGSFAGIAMSQVNGTKVINNAIAVMKSSIDATCFANTGLYYQGQAMSTEGLTLDKNIFWSGASTSTTFGRFYEMDANNNAISPSWNFDDFKTLEQWLAWFGTNKNSFVGNWVKDLVNVSDPSQKLRIQSNPTPMGSILNNRGEKLTEVSTDVDGVTRGVAGQRPDVGAIEFTGRMYVSDVEVDAITAPAVYKSTAGNFSDAEYIMTGRPIEVKALIRNNGNLLQAGARLTVTVSKQELTGGFTKVFENTVRTSALAAGESTEIAFNLADGQSPDFTPQTYYELGVQASQIVGKPWFANMLANVTPVYKIDVAVESDEFNANNTATKRVRFYIPRTNIGFLVSAENSWQNINYGDQTLTFTQDQVAGKLNYDSLMAGLKYLAWKHTGTMNVNNPTGYLFDVFDRSGWEPKTVDYTLYRSIAWSDGHEKALSRFERADIKKFAGSGLTTDKKNLIYAGQELLRKHSSAVVSDPDRDLSLVNGIFRSTNRTPWTYDFANMKKVTGSNVGRNLSFSIKATGWDVLLWDATHRTGDADPSCALMSINASGEGLALPGFYYYNTTSNKATDSLMSVATTTLSRNVLYLGADWRHLGSLNGMMRSVVDFLEKNGGNVVPVELLSFDAKEASNRVLLSWTTASELNSDKFEVERNSGNGYVKIDEVKAAGNSSEQRNYDLVDRKVEIGKEYSYRLKMVDLTGEWKYSNEVSVRVSDAAFFSGVTPNPVSSLAKVSYSLNAEGTVTIELFDMSGKLAKTINLGTKTSGNHEEELNLSDLSSGSYTVVIRSNESTMTKTIQVVK